MDEVLPNVWLCRDEDHPHFWEGDNTGWWTTVFTEMNESCIAAQLARALLAERERAGKLAELLRQALDF